MAGFLAAAGLWALWCPRSDRVSRGWAVFGRRSSVLVIRHAGRRLRMAGPAGVAAGASARRPGERLPADTRAGRASVRVQVADQRLATKAGVHGVILGVSRADKVATAGRVHLQLDYSQFANAFGANFGDRL